MKLYDLLMLLKCSSTSYVVVDVVCVKTGTVNHYHGYSSELLNDIRLRFLQKSLVVDFVNGYTISIVCVYNY